MITLQRGEFLKILAEGIAVPLPNVGRSANAFGLVVGCEIELAGDDPGIEAVFRSHNVPSQLHRGLRDRIRTVVAVIRGDCFNHAVGGAMSVFCGWQR
jgi:hypothetical protein